MHEIEPNHHWRDFYIASEDKRSPFYGKVNSEVYFENKIYNFIIHPQWDYFGSDTLFIKLIFADYEREFVIIELIGEWNDCITNDVMHLKRNIVDRLIDEGITKFILVCDNVLNFHIDDDDYYEEWYDDIAENDGWICLLNTTEHVETELLEANLEYFLNFGIEFNYFNWRKTEPVNFFNFIDEKIQRKIQK